MAEKFTIGRNSKEVRVVDLDTGEEVHQPEIAARFLETVDSAITAAGGRVVEVPDKDRSHLELVPDEDANVIQLFPNQDPEA